MSKSHLEHGLAIQMQRLLLPKPVREYRFARVAVGDEPHPPARTGLRKRLREAGLRDWMFDFAWPEHKLAVEVEGGSWAGGRHTRGSGFAEDCEKYNKAAELGWTVLRYPGGAVSDGSAVTQIERMLAKLES